MVVSVLQGSQIVERDRLFPPLFANSDVFSVVDEQLVWYPVWQAKTTSPLSRPRWRTHNFLQPRVGSTTGKGWRDAIRASTLSVSFDPRVIEDHACPNADLWGILLRDPLFSRLLRRAGNTLGLFFSTREADEQTKLLLFTKTCLIFLLRHRQPTTCHRSSRKSTQRAAICC